MAAIWQLRICGSIFRHLKDVPERDNSPDHRNPSMSARVCSIVAGLMGMATTLAAAAPPLSFNRDIRPLLSDACFKCHGPDATARQADLRLDTREGLFSPRPSGTPVVPRDLAASLIWQRITQDDPAQRMPPVDSGKSLTPAQVHLLKAWIEAGAPWADHWAFVSPRRPPLPTVRQSDWPRNAIDQFVLHALEQRTWGPQPEATPETLLRRVTLDLTGLPPRIEEVEAYLADPAPDRYERLVDRLLASPRYGEHLAVDWLDAARYADTSGYQNDGPRDMWRWRDWVIAAFNANRPFDEFTVEQLAGDLLTGDEAAGVLRQPRGYLPRSPRSVELLVATGFQRNHRGNSEGGIIPEEYAVEYVADRVDTLGAVWLGLTIGCARCHAHKYDPISQTDYYRLFAYFHQVPEYGRAIKEGNSPPYITAPTSEQWSRLKHLEAEWNAAREEWDRLQPQRMEAQAAWERSAALGLDADYDVTGGLVAHFSLAGHLRDNARPHFAARLNTGSPEYEPGPFGQALRLDGGQFVDAGDTAKFGYFDAFSATAWVQPGPSATGGLVTRTSDDAYADGWTFQLVNGRLQVNLVKRWLDDAIRVETESAVAPGRWQHVAMTYDGSRTAQGIAVYLDGVPQPLTVHYDFLNQSFTNDEPLRIGSTGTQQRFQGAMAEVRVYRRALTSEEVAILATRDSIAAAAATAADRRTPGQAAKLQAYFLEHAAPPEIAQAWQRVRRAEHDYRRFLAALPTAMVMVDHPRPRETAVLQRGVYDRPGERVSPGVPSALAQATGPVAGNRLDLARWLVDRQHPLTARVTVNRLWQRFFGTGLVKTSEDFGTQGEPPSHPELLDWLALELIDHDWDLKHVQRTIVTSAVYRQASRGNPAWVQADPENRWLARGPRFRMSAEMLRDQALAVGGLLEERLGGPSIKPYQPPGLWQEIATDTAYEPSPPPDRYRRGVYCYIKRTVANPAMVLFDAPTREACVLRRSRTNTPLQALTLWNDVTFVEAARHLAYQSLRSAATRDPADILTDCFRRVLARRPDAAELDRLTTSWRHYRAHFQHHPREAEALLRVGTEAPVELPEHVSPADAAAFAIVASIVLNLDEAVTRE
jgi:hypothetical protein